jgi:hypothetical protein
MVEEKRKMTYDDAKVSRRQCDRCHLMERTRSGELFSMVDDIGEDIELCMSCALIYTQDNDE